MGVEYSAVGVYGYPLDAAAELSVGVVRQFLAARDRPALVRWVMFDSAAHDAWIAVCGPMPRG